MTKRTGFWKSGQIRAITLDETNSASVHLCRVRRSRNPLGYFLSASQQSSWSLVAANDEISDGSSTTFWEGSKFKSNLMLSNLIIRCPPQARIYRAYKSGNNINNDLNIWQGTQYVLAKNANFRCPWIWMIYQKTFRGPPAGQPSGAAADFWDFAFVRQHGIT